MILCVHPTSSNRRFFWNQHLNPIVLGVPQTILNLLRIFGFMDIYLWIQIYIYFSVPPVLIHFFHIFLFFSIVFHFFSDGNNSSSRGGPLGGDGNGGGHWRSGSRPEPRGGFSKARWLMIIGCHLYIYIHIYIYIYVFMIYIYNMHLYYIYIYISM